MKPSPSCLTPLGLALTLLLTAPAAGQTAPQTLFVDVVESSLPGHGREIVPVRQRAVRFDMDGLARALAGAPLETPGPMDEGIVLALPVPDGTTARFLVQESPIMEAPLQAQFPQIRTYRAQGLDDPTATGRFDLTPTGFHAQVLAAGGSYYIDPWARGDREHYQSYFRRDLRGRAGLTCAFEAENPDASRILGVEPPSRELGRSPLISSGTTLRIYRLALAGTGEYTAFFGGTVPLALAEMVIAMNRINGIYERDVALRMVLVANNSLIIYTNGATDPYTNNNGVAMLGENQANLDTVIGSANYDIGHVFSTGGGGVATLNSPCSGSKARGVTGLPTPVGDPFYVDFVAHEMGHQWGAPHTFNGTTGNCGGGNRSASDAYEPGSGSTIMAYAGICGAEDLQPNSDDYFHHKSLDRIIIFSTGGGNCAPTQTPTGNSIPVAEAGAAFQIPAQTPFTLTGSGTDADLGDALTFCWEQYDLGTQAPPNTDNGNRPIFRSFSPVAGVSRTFPRLSDIVNNTITFGESLPTTTRTMQFRLTVRDNRANGGGVHSDSTTVTSNSGAGPFVVTAPDTAVTWASCSTQTVTWNVANTTAAPISCANVDILLSTDGGTTFPITLAAGTPNDGTQQIVVPTGLATTLARVKVLGAGNIFFDLGNANFTITGGAGGCPPSINAGGALARTQGSPATNSTVATVADAETPAGSLTVVQIAGGTATGVTFSNIVNTGGTVTADVIASCTATSGTVRLQVTDGNAQTSTADVTVNVTTNPAPTQGTYPASTTVNAGAGTTVTPNASPSDNGGIATLTATAPLFTGTLVGNTGTGVVTVSSAGPPGVYTVTVTATDNCGATSTRTFGLTVNGAPALASSGISIPAGNAALPGVAVGTASDDLTAAGSLTVVMVAGGTATGVTVTNVVNAGGTVTAQIATACNATSGSVKFQVTDGGGLSTTVDVAVTVTANPGPTQGTYVASVGVNQGGGTVVTPNAGPTDNGSVATVTAAAPGFSGTLNVNTGTGAVTIGNAGPAGAYTVTVTATDNCGVTSTRTFGLTVNGAPGLSSAGISRAAGSLAGNLAVGTVADDLTAAGSLSVAHVVGGTATGVTVTNVANTGGNVTADVATACNATAGTVKFQVTDGGGLSTTVDVALAVPANPGPVLGTYPATSLSDAGSGNVTPDAAPTDNGTVATLTAAAPGFTGTLTGNPTTGVVSVSNAGPVGGHTVTVTATDSCGATSTRTFTLTVTSTNTTPQITAGPDSTRSRGAAGTSATIATVADAETSPGSLVVSVLNAPADISIAAITNTAGTVTATVAAGCNAALGAGTVTLQVSDGTLTQTASYTVNVTANASAPVVTLPSPATVTVNQTECVPGSGTTLDGLVTRFPNQFSDLFSLVNGGSAVDDCTATPTKLTARVAGVDVTTTTLFPLGSTPVELRFSDADANVGTATVTVVVRRQGDVNGDTIVDVNDLIGTANLIVGNLTAGTPPFTAPFLTADVDGNGIVDVFDLLQMAGFIVGNVSCLAP